jgi:hypothetical protein
MSFNEHVWQHTHTGIHKIINQNILGYTHEICFSVLSVPKGTAIIVKNGFNQLLYNLHYPNTEIKKADQMCKGAQTPDNCRILLSSHRVNTIPELKNVHRHVTQFPF